MIKPTRALFLGVATGLVTAFLWGSWAVVSRLGLTTSLDFQDVTALRFFVAGTVLLPALVHKGIGRRHVAGVPWRAAFLMWLGAGAPYALVVFAGLQIAPASHQAVIAPAAVMLFTAALGWALLGESLKPAQLAGFAVILAGVAAIGWQGLTAATGEVGRGHMLFVISSLGWSVFTVTARAWRVDALIATAIISVLSLVAYLPVYLLLTGDRILRLPPVDAVFQGIYQGLITGVIALWLYTRTVEALGAGRAALFTALVPAMAAVLAVPILGEPITVLSLAGAVLVTIGMILAVGRAAISGRKACD